jgi:ketosteroid isomerase-like protein
VDDAAIRAALERHWSDVNDQDVVHEIYHDDVVLEFPQGGERLVGLANIRAMRAVYPSALTMTTERIRGSGTLWVAENVITYDGKPMHTVNILEFRDGKVTHETIYFGDPWEPPAWRAQWVEQVEPAAAQIGQAAADPPARGNRFR